MNERVTGRRSAATTSDNPIDITDETGSAEALLSELFYHGVRVSADGDTLRCTGATNILAGPMGARIKAMKPAILAFLHDNQTGTGTLIPRQADAPLTLSAAQKRLWVLECIDPESAHHMPFALEALGELDLPALRDALCNLTQRHEGLRLRILDDDAPTVYIAKDTAPQIAEQDIAGLDDASVDDLIRAEFARPFDLSCHAPVRLRVLQQGKDRHLLLFTLHHIAADGTSIEILMRDFAALYGEAVAGFAAGLPDLPIQYGDYAAWQNSPDQRAHHDQQLTFWQDQLGDDLPITRLFGDHARPPVQSMAGAAHPLEISPVLTEQLRLVGAAQGATLFAVLYAAFNVLVHRYTGQSDLVTGIPSANRTRPETENLVGLFVNPLAVRCQVNPQQSFTQTLRDVQKALLKAQDHQDVPFEQVVARVQTLRDPGASPLFQLKFQLDRASRDTLDLPGVVLRRRAIPTRIARHDLSLNLVEETVGKEGTVTGHIEYASALFDPDTIARFGNHFITLLSSIVQSPDQPIGTLEYLTPAERRDMLDTWNDSAQPLDPAARFPQLFEAHAAARPDAIALCHVAEDGTQRSETYGALNARANRLAHALRAAGAGPETVVAIALDRGPDQVAAWLGVLKSGAAYLPLDPAYPVERLAFMLGDSGAAIVLTQADFPLGDGTARWNLDQHWPEESATNPEPFADPNDLAYLIYTSGSTGRPKGVEVPHAGLVNLTLDKLRRCQVTPDARVFGFFSFSFDASIPDLVMSLGGGATLVTASGDDVLPGPQMARVLRDQGVTHLTITPSALANLPADDLPALRMVLVGGEAPSRELIERWSPGRLFLNAYGPTECTVNASMVVCGNGHPLDPTLQAPANKQLHVLDANAQLLPVGCPGELCIGGVGLARGYRGLPEKTGEAFIPDPFHDAPARLYRTGDWAMRLADGRIKLLGRMDDQVKIRGYRVEPGEVARICATLEGVAEAVVVPRDIQGGVRLVAYLVAAGDRRPQDEVLAKLKSQLPRHMIPDGIVWLDALPLTVNGKLDTAALPEPVPTDTAGRAPTGRTETALARIFADLLHVDAPDAEADFFDLGGTSLQVTRLVAAIEDQFGQRLRALDLFDGASIAVLAKRIDGNTGGTVEAPWIDDLTLDPTITPTGPFDLSDGLPACILMTGATGFVGAHLLAELLRAPDRQVLCLTRSNGARGLELALRRYDLWRPGLGHRIHAISGDLGQPGLGITPIDHARIAQKVRAVVHCGAAVHHLTPYARLRAANVSGTVETLRLCCDLNLPLHSISTLSALTYGDTPLNETVAAHNLAPPQGGYNQTKWVAEQLIHQAQARGLPVTTYRLGSIAGSTQTGAFNDADILVRQVQGYVASGLAPEGSALINLLPVDYLARAICHLAAQPDTTGATFHMIHSKAFSSDQLFTALQDAGHQLTRVAPTDWQDLLGQIARNDPDHPLYPLAALGGAQGFTGTRWPYACDATRAALCDLPEPAMDAAALRPLIGAITADLANPTPQGPTTTMTETPQDYDTWAWLYDRTLGPDYNRAKMGFFDRVVLDALPQGARVLDLCCGTGQMMAHMLGRTLDVTGLDLSADMLRHAAKNVPDAQLIQGDARNFVLDQPVAAVICASASLNHMETLDDLRLVFRAVHAALDDGGTFVFDINHPEQMAKHWTGRPAAGDIRSDYAWMITPQYDAQACSGGFTVDMYRRGEARLTPNPVIRALLRRPILRRVKLARLAAFSAAYPDWDHKRVTYPVHGHAIGDVLHLLKEAGFTARVETLSGTSEIDADSAACFIAQKSKPQPRTAA